MKIKRLNSALVLFLAFMLTSCGERPKAASLSEQQAKVYPLAQLDERWVLETAKGVTTHCFYTSGQYRFSVTEIENNFESYGEGTYHYQAETGEFYLHINRSQAHSETGKYGPSLNYKAYLKVKEYSDTTVVVSALWGKVADWEVDSSGMYHLLRGKNEQMPSDEIYVRTFIESDLPENE